MSIQGEIADEHDRRGIDSWRLARYTTRARRIATLAQEEARRFNHAYLGAEHLLLAIVRDGESNAAHILVGLGVDLQELGSTIELHLGRGDQPVSGVLPKTPRLDKARECAAREASQVGAARIGTEHLLFGLLSEGGNVAAKVLTNFGVHESEVRDQVARLGADGERREAGPEAPKGIVLTCRITDHDRDVLDTLVEVGFRTSRSDAAAWAIHAGLDAHQALVEKAVTALAEMRRLRDEVQSMTTL